MGYKDIFFDLDHTLWDYNTSAKQTLFELYDRYELSATGALEKEKLLEAFLTINEDLWDQYNKGEVSKYFLRTQRFNMVFEKIGVNQKLFPQDQVLRFNHDYLHECPQKPNLIDGALELLDELEGNFNLHIITNGFNDIQGTKLEMSGLSKFFKYVITSESAGAKKPFSGIFEFAFKATNANLQHSIMIGDNLTTDIKGARDFGLDQVYFNPDKIHHSEEVMHEVYELQEILRIVS
ncbi:YjjG family noncanonical pyrimidine nucleotidase [Reichenbachiella sp. MALMAid0571]|uniref:YjjG family noncanonical pyrimidine nucleotidase n=1 Tax=Reichenbachiella sp. MALMAid0571 TaxID=3143939 RepID=UPI0032DEC0B6